MNPRSSRWLILLALITLTSWPLAFTGCGGDDGTTSPPPPVVNLPHELVGDWAVASVTVNGTATDPAEFFEWDTGATGSMLLTSSNGSYVEREYAADRSILASSSGTISIDEDVITVTESGSGNTVVFHGDWSVFNHVLTLQQDDGTDSTIITFHQIRSVTIEFTVRQISDSNNLLGGTISEGRTGRGFYSYDLTVPNSSDLTGVAGYVSTLSPCGFFVDLAGFVFKTDLSNPNLLLEISNNFQGSDHYLVRTYNNLPVSSQLAAGHHAWQLDDETQSALDDTALPLTAPVLADWTQIPGLRLEGTGNGGMDDFTIFCTVTRAFLAE